jgi:predicted nuclease with TOPRIM domain
MNVKTEKVVDLFIKRNQTENALIIKVLDSITDFKRKIELLPAFKEFQEIFEEFRKEEQKLIKKTIHEYVVDRNKVIEERNKENKEKVDLLDETKLDHIPQECIPEYSKKIQEILNVDLKINKPLLFTQKEIEGSNVSFTEIVRLEPFMIPQLSKK